MFSKKDLEHLAELSRMKLKSSEEKTLQNDLGAILDFFKELQELDTEKVEPMTGGTSLKNSVREDVLGTTNDTGKGPEQFPEEKDNGLKVPPIF